MKFIIPVKPNPAYYDRKLPKSTSQFMSIWLKVSDGDKNHSILAMKKMIDENIHKFVEMVD